MAKIDAAKIWSLNYWLLMSVITSVSLAVAELGLDTKELFVLAAIDDNPHPAALASALCMPKPSVTFNLKSLEAAGFVKREIDPDDLRRHKLIVTPSGRKVMTRGLALLSDAFGERLGRLKPAEQAELKGMLERMA